MPSNYTADPPEEEGWYWVAVDGEVQYGPALLMSSHGHWFCLHRDLPGFRWGDQKESVLRSIHPATPLPFTEDDR